MKVPAVEGWFSMDESDPRLLGNKCTSCGTVFFPRAAIACRNPSHTQAPNLSNTSSASFMMRAMSSATDGSSSIRPTT